MQDRVYKYSPMSLLLPYSVDNDYNRFGYYSVGQTLTYSKQQALELSESTGSTLSWHFNDEIFSNMDWTMPGHRSLEDLYRQRAQQLRDRYDYLVLLYSGGADSHNVFMSFVKNHIHLDEVMHIIELEGDRDPMSFANAEITKVAYPTAKEIIREFNLKTNHRLVDVSEIILNLYQWTTDEEWIHFLRYHYSPINLARSFIREKTPAYQDLIDKGLKVGFIWGGDKPHLIGLRHKTNGSMSWAVAFSDRCDGQITDRQKYLNRSWEHDEFFYWSPDLPDLVRSQSHAIMSYMKKSLNHTHCWQPGTEIRETGCCVQQGQWVYLKKDIAHALIYPYWDPSTFSNGKTRSNVFSDKDMWLLKDRNLETVQVMLAAIKRLQNSSNWTGLARGMKSLWSRLYPLENIGDLENWDIKFPY